MEELRGIRRDMRELWEGLLGKEKRREEERKKWAEKNQEEEEKEVRMEMWKGEGDVQGEREVE